MLSIMGMNDQRRGFLEANGSPLRDPREIARLTGGDAAEVTRLLSELEKAGVFSRSDAGCVYSRRMVRDERIRVVRSEAGAKGGNPNIKHQEPPQPARSLVKQTVNQEVKAQVKPCVGSGCGSGNGNGSLGSGDPSVSVGECEGEAVPTVDEVIAFGAKYPGDLPRGIPAQSRKSFALLTTKPSKSNGPG
jgi:hypothetical protein